MNRHASALERRASSLTKRALRTLAALTLALLGACDFGGVVKCDGDAACPQSAPFCVDGSCAVTQPIARPGPCARDDECDNGALCATSGARVGVCVPPADVVDDCANAQAEPTRARDAGGPALFDVSLAASSASSASCSNGDQYDIHFSYFDAEGDVAGAGEFVEVLFERTDPAGFDSASALVGSSVDGDTTAASVIFTACEPMPTAPVAIYLEDKASHRSNVVCAAPPP